MTARERVLMIRLAEKLKKHPTYARVLVLEATSAVNNQNRTKEAKGLPTV